MFAVELELLIIELRLKLKEIKVITTEEIKTYLETISLSAIEKGEYRKLKMIELMGVALVDYSEFQKTIDDFSGREKIVFGIYKRLNTINQHKMIPIPICHIDK